MKFRDIPLRARVFVICAAVALPFLVFLVIRWSSDINGWLGVFFAGMIFAIIKADFSALVARIVQDLLGNYHENLLDKVDESETEGLLEDKDSKRYAYFVHFGEMLGMLVPIEIRERCFDPYFEDLKQDQLRKLAKSKSPWVKGWVRFCFGFRLAMTVVEALVCYVAKVVRKALPFLDWFKRGS